MEIGYTLSSEEHPPDDLVRNARRAEEAGFSFGFISDHFHPWVRHQGNSPFVWAVIGAISRETERLRLGTGVTCPTVRMHPAVVAHAAATVAVMLPGRFFLGLGSGENLNEHVVGAPWPPVDERHEMLEEAVEIIRLLWRGDLCSYRGQHYRVDNARLHTRPAEPPPIFLSAHGPKATRLAGRVADGLIGVAPLPERPQLFRDSGGAGKPTMGQVKVCYAEDEAEARRTARQWWPTIGLGGQLAQDLALPAHYEAAARLVTEDHVARMITCGPDPSRHLAAIEQYLDAGYEQVTVHQVGPHQEAFFRFYAEEILPRLGQEHRAGPTPARGNVDRR